jgi:hypothetical protein
MTKMKKNPWRGTSEDFGDFFVQHYYNFAACEWLFSGL